MNSDDGVNELQVMYYTDGPEYDYVIELSGSYGDSVGGFSGVVVSNDGETYTAVDDSGNVVIFTYNGWDKIEITYADNTGGMYFPGFEGTYRRTQDYKS